MQRIIISILLTAILGLYSCKDTKTNTSQANPSTTEIDTKPIEKQKSEPETVKVYSWVDKLRIREEPNTKSEIVKELKEGEALTFLGKKTDFTKKINLRGTLYDEPWLEVETSDGKKGWAYGGGIKFYKPVVDAKPSPYDGCIALLAKGRTEQYQKCYTNIQERQLRKDKKVIRSTNTGYEVKLLDGDVEKLENKIDTEIGTAISFQYRYYIPEMGFYVFQKIDTEEGDSYVVMNDKSGKTTGIPAYPKAAPDHKHVLCMKYKQAEDDDSGIELYGFTDNGFEQVFEEALENHYPSSPKWIDGENLEITLEPFDNDGFYTTKIIQLQLDEGTWKKK